MSGCVIVTSPGVVRDVLTSVECNTRSFARLGYESLTAPGSAFQTALTLLLTVYVALIGYRLLFGSGARLADGPGIALKIGAVLALLTSWSLFQTLVFDVAARAPVQIAAAISAPLRGAATLAADPVDGLQTAYDRLGEAAILFTKPANSTAPGQKDFATAAQALSLAANALLVAGAGLIAVITVVIGVLTATGPLFIALFLFLETRGFFVGWVRAMGAAALALLSSWALDVLMLNAVTPWLDALAMPSPQPQTAITAAAIVLIFAASQVGLALAAIMIARSFRLPGRTRRAPVPAQAVETVTRAVIAMPSRPILLSEQLARVEIPSAWSSRPVLAAAAAPGPVRRAAPRGAPGAAGAHIGDFYRRPVVGRAEERR